MAKKIKFTTGNWKSDDSITIAVDKIVSIENKHEKESNETTLLVWLVNGIGYQVITHANYIISEIEKVIDGHDIDDSELEFSVIRKERLRLDEQ